MSKEVLTFQLGNLSNYVGTHWWNLQEASFVYCNDGQPYESEINHDVMFREGMTLEGAVTYTPRLISLDLKDGLKNLKLEGSLYDLEPSSDTDTISWSHSVTQHKEDPKGERNEFLEDLDALENPEMVRKKPRLEECPSRDEMEVDSPLEQESRPEAPTLESIRQKFYQLDDIVTSWSDFLRLHLHPRTMSVVRGYSHNESSFSIHNCGSTAYNGSCIDLQTDLEDRIHFFTEEADHLQGFHMICDTTDGFGGVASGLSSDLQDEFPKRGILTFCPFHTKPKDVPDSHRILINTALSVVRLKESGCCLVPLSSMENPFSYTSHNQIHLPHLQYKGDLPYHVSAIFAVAADTATLGHRLVKSAVPLSHLVDNLTATGRQVSNLAVNFPFPLRRHHSVLETFRSLSDPWTSLTPLYDTTVSMRTNVQSVVLRGVKPMGDQLFEELQSRFPGIPSSVVELRQECNTQSPFPHIFTDDVDEYGCISSTPRTLTRAVSRASVLTSLSTTDGSYPFLSHLLSRANKITEPQLHKHKEAGLEQDDWRDVLASLQDLTDRYCDQVSLSDTDSSS